MRGLGLRLLALVLVGAAYAAWRPVRVEIGRHVVAPLVAAWAPEGLRVRTSTPASVDVLDGHGREVASYRMPLGVQALLGALGLAAAFPRRPRYVAALVAGHLLLGVLDLALVLHGLDAPGWLVGGRLLATLRDGVTLAALALCAGALMRRRPAAGALTPAPPPAPGPPADVAPAR